MNDEILAKLLALEVVQYRKLKGIDAVLGGGIDAFWDALSPDVHFLVLDLLGLPRDDVPDPLDGTGFCRDAWGTAFQEICDGDADPEAACVTYLRRIQGDGHLSIQPFVDKVPA